MTTWTEQEITEAAKLPDDVEKAISEYESAVHAQCDAAARSAWSLLAINHEETVKAKADLSLAVLAALASKAGEV